MKKFIAMALALVLVAGLSIGGTVAYLQDSDSQKNVMAVGSVQIEQHEYQRAEGKSHINAGAVKGDLVKFDQNQTIYPAVPVNNLATDYSAETANERQFWWGYYTGGNGSNGLWDDAKLKNVMDKIVIVENTGDSAAYYRTLIAIECPEGMTVGEAGAGAEIMLNVNLNTRFEWKDVGYITVGGTRYHLTYANYIPKLAPKEISRPSLLQAVLTHHATNEDMVLLGDTLDILVLSQAVQTEGFDTADQALDRAFGDVTVANAEAWFAGVTMSATASTQEEVQNAVHAGASKIVLENDISIANEGCIGFTGGETIVLDLNGHKLTGNGYIMVGFNGTLNIIGSRDDVTCGIFDRFGTVNFSK